MMPASVPQGGRMGLRALGAGSAHGRRRLAVPRVGCGTVDGFAANPQAMALKSTIFKAQLQLADMDRHVYGDHALTLARHPSETDERMMMRLLAFALLVPADDHGGMLEFAKGLSDTDEPDLWQKDLTGALVQWVEMGQPDDRRLLRAAGRAERVSVFAYSSSVPLWWQPLAGKLSRTDNVAVWQVPAEQSQALATLAERSMRLQVNIQDGTLWIDNGQRSVEVTPVPLLKPRTA